MWLRCVDHIEGGEPYPLNPAHVVCFKRREDWWRAFDIRGEAHDVVADDEAKVEAIIAAGEAGDVTEQPATRPQRLLCLACGTETAPGAPIDACPGCGDDKHVPADLDDTATVTITKHELRILTIWAANWAAQCGPIAQQVIGTILTRLGTQTDAPLSLSQEIADLRAAFPASQVTVTDGTGTELDL